MASELEQRERGDFLLTKQHNMPFDENHPGDLLHYLPSYRVLICKRCRYAIQPSAIGRHFKDIHRIHSKARQPFIEYSRSLNLAEPADVVYPSQDNFPVAYLPVEQGWRCEAPHCEYMCVSEKRMEMHWSSMHRCKGVSVRDWSAVPLQTFFRGNMLRYFSGHRILPQHQATPQNCGFYTIPAPTRDRMLLKQCLIERYQLQEIDVEALDQYFTSTYNTFVINESDSRVHQIWLEIVPGLALDHPFLLSGVLASSCLHLAHLTPRRGSQWTTRGIAHLDSAIPAFRHAIEHPSTKNCDPIMAFAYLLLVVTIASEGGSHWEDPLLFVRDIELEEQHLILPQWVSFLRAGCSMLSGVWGYIEEGPMQCLVLDLKAEAVPAEAVQTHLERFLNFIPVDDSWSDVDTAVYKEAARALAESFVQIEQSRKIRADGQAHTFNVLACWPIRMHDATLVLLSKQHPGMLILLAHYCVCLKQLDGYWYLENRAVALMSTIELILQPRWHPYIQEPRSIVLAGQQCDNVTHGR